MLKLLVVAAPAEVDRLAAAAAAMGALAVAAGEPEDFAEAVVSVRPDAVVLADGGLTDPLAAVQRVRAVAGGQTPVVFLGDAPAATRVEGFVDAAFRRPLDAQALVSRAAELTAFTAPPDPERLRQLGQAIDEVLAAELVSALAPGPAAQPAADVVPAPALEISWRDLLGVEEATPAPEPWHGDLADVDLPMLLGRIHGGGLTGRLQVGAGAERAVWFEAGRPVRATSSDPGERMADMLVRQGRLTAAERAMAGRAADQGGRRMGALLVDLGLLPAGELLAVVRAHFEALVLALFRLTAGPWRFEPGVLGPPGEVRLLRHPAALVREGLGGQHAQQRLGQRLGSPHNVFALETGPGAAELLAEIAPSPSDARVLLLCDGVRPLDEVIRLGDTPSAEAVLYCAWAFSLLRPAGDPALPARDLELLRARLHLRHELALDGDYFQVLGVSRRATAEEVQQAHQRLAEDLAVAAAQPDLAALAATVREVADEARSILTSPSLRGPYQAALPPQRR
jgi:hypothetical protein